MSSGVFCTQCEPEGFRRITYFPDRPDVLARYTVTLRADRAAFPVLLSNGNLVAQGRAAGRPPLRDVARPVSQAVVPVRARRGRPCGARGHASRRCPAARSRCASTRRRATSRAAVTRWRRSRRAFRWDEERFGREYDLDAFMIFCADDFNMGAMENKGLNIFNSRLVLADPATATDDDYAAIEGGDRPRVFPQLDRQPRHLPRLVPAVAEGRPHRLPRPGILERPPLARRRAHRRGRVPAPRAVPRGRGTDGAQRAARRVPRDQQLLHGDRLREGRRSDPHAAHAARPGALPPRHATSTSSATTAWR